MPTYKVLRPIEHNQTVYLPAAPGSGIPHPEKLPSGSHGGIVAVNSTGLVELTEAEAGEFLLGQVPLFDGKPDSLEAAKKRAADAAKTEPGTVRSGAEAEAVKKQKLETRK